MATGTATGSSARSASVPDGLIVLRTGTLYTVLKRLLELDLVEDSDKRPAPDEDDERRRYYRLTAFGRTVMAAEARRLESVVALARDKRVLKARPV